MHLMIRKDNLQWSDALASYAEDRIRRGLDRFRVRVGTVLVRLADINGPRGGEDKRCLVSVRLASGQLVMVNSRDSCPYRAIDAAVSRLKRSVRERIRRNRSRRRREA